MSKPHLFRSGQYWICAAHRNDHHILRGGVGYSPREAYSMFMSVIGLLAFVL